MAPWPHPVSVISSLPSSTRNPKGVHRLCTNGAYSWDGRAHPWIPGRGRTEALSWGNSDRADPSLRRARTRCDPASLTTNQGLHLGPLNDSSKWKEQESVTLGLEPTLPGMPRTSSTSSKDTHILLCICS